ncbi:outer membrane lipoprotein carrier protein LolA, partial [Myxococcota bacterium]|nr:outer membrane lipoprotein carrier protein LolA [Myxococcota bacterium]
GSGTFKRERGDLIFANRQKDSRGSMRRLFTDPLRQRKARIFPRGHSIVRKARRGAGIWLALLGLPMLAAGTSPGTEAVAAPASLSDLMTVLAQSGPVRASFQESRTLAVLVDPIETTGELYFIPPKRLARVTQWPSPAKVIVDGSLVTIEDGLGQRALNLEESPVGRSLIGGIVVLLGGDFEGLNRIYDTVYEAHDEAWTLTMVPINSNLRAMIREIRAEGRGQSIIRITTLETNGDVTTTELRNIESGVPIAEIEQAAFSSTTAPRK